MSREFDCIQLQPDWIIFRDGDTEISIPRDAELNKKIKWLVSSKSEMVLTYKNDSSELFFGPYVKGTETGYIFQIINHYSRNVTSLTIPFTEEVNINTIKEYINSML